MPKSKTATLVSIEHIAQSVILLRGQRVLLDRDLAVLYGVETRRLNESRSAATASASRRTSYSS